MDEINITPFLSLRLERLFEIIICSEINKNTYNVTISSTKQHPQGFHNSESNNSESNALHMTLLHPPAPPTPLL